MNNFKKILLIFINIQAKNNFSKIFIMPLDTKINHL
jgi:hypothetical protein